MYKGSAFFFFLKKDKKQDKQPSIREVLLTYTYIFSQETGTKPGVKLAIAARESFGVEQNGGSDPGVGVDLGQGA